MFVTIYDSDKNIWASDGKKIPDGAMPKSSTMHSRIVEHCDLRYFVVATLVTDQTYR
jgi:hypothetical protein